MIVTTLHGFKIDLKNGDFVKDSSCSACGNDHKFTIVHDETKVECLKCGLIAKKVHKEILADRVHFDFRTSNTPVITGRGK